MGLHGAGEEAVCLRALRSEARQQREVPVLVLLCAIRHLVREHAPLLVGVELFETNRAVGMTFNPVGRLPPGPLLRERVDGHEQVAVPDGGVVLPVRPSPLQQMATTHRCGFVVQLEPVRPCSRQAQKDTGKLCPEGRRPEPMHRAPQAVAVIVVYGYTKLALKLSGALTRAAECCSSRQGESRLRWGSGRSRPCR